MCARARAHRGARGSDLGGGGELFPGGDPGPPLRSYGRQTEPGAARGASSPPPRRAAGEELSQQTIDPRSPTPLRGKSCAERAGLFVPLAPFAALRALGSRTDTPSEGVFTAARCLWGMNENCFLKS